MYISIVRQEDYPLAKLIMGSPYTLVRSIPFYVGNEIICHAYYSKIETKYRRRSDPQNKIL